MRSKTRWILAAATAGICGVFSPSGNAQEAFYFGDTYLQNFDGLPSSGYAATPLPNKTTPMDLTQPYPVGVGAGQSLTGWYASRMGSGTNEAQFFTTNGSNVQASIGGLASFGANGSFERALGSVSNTGAEVRFGVKLVNFSENPITAFTIQYDVEQWSSASTTIDFNNRLEYAVGATDLNTGVFKVIGPVDQTAGGGSWNSFIASGNATLDGNSNKRHKLFTVAGINWQVGQSLVIRWNDVNDANAEAGLGIDNFSFVGSSLNHILDWKGTPDGTWNTSVSNTPWTNTSTSAASSFVAGDTVNFPAILANAAITVDAAGVAPASTTISNQSNVYTFTGGAISGPLTKEGAGTAVFSSANNFSSVEINQGTVELKVSNALGAVAPISLGNATLNFTTNSNTLANPLTVIGAAVIKHSVPLTISGAISGDAGTSLAINNTSASTLLLPNLFGSATPFAGDFRVMAGVVKYSGATDGQFLSPTALLTVDAGGTLDLGVNGEKLGAIQGGGNIILKDAPGEFLTLGNPGNFNFSGVISGNTTNPSSLGLHQAGGGLLTLSGNSTFSAPVTISNGGIAVGANVLPNADSPLGNSNLPITVGLGSSNMASVSLFINGAFEVARPVNVTSNTNAVSVTLGGNGNGNSLFSGPVNLGTSVQLTSAANDAFAVTFSGPLLGSAGGNQSITKIGEGVVTIGSTANTYTGATTVNAGTLRVTGSVNNSSGVTVNSDAVFDAAATQTVKALAINNGGLGKVSAGVLKIGDNTAAAPLTISSSGGNTGKLDVTTQGVIIDYPAGSEVATLSAIRAQIIRGYNASAPGAGDGNWQGPGITTSSMIGNNKAVVGYAQASEIALGPNNTFMGSPVDGDALVIRGTLNGDSNLDGTVGFADLVAVAQHYGLSDGSAMWVQGDFNFDGKVGFADLVAVAQNYGGSVPVGPIAGAPLNFSSDMAAAFASIPEPASFALINIGAIWTLFHRRRKQ